MSQKVPIFTLMNSNDRDINRPVTAVGNQIVLKKERRFSKKKVLISLIIFVAVLTMAIIVIIALPKTETKNDILASSTAQEALYRYSNWILEGEENNSDEVFKSRYEDYYVYEIDFVIASDDSSRKEIFFQKAKQYFDEFMNLYHLQDNYNEILYGTMIEYREQLESITKSALEKDWYKEVTNRKINNITSRCWTYNEQINGEKTNDF